MLKDYQNTLKAEAYKRKGEFINLILNPRASSIESLIQECEAITYEDFVDMRKTWLHNITSEWQIQGHILEEDAVELVQHCEGIIKEYKADVDNKKNFVVLNSNTVNEFMISHSEPNNLNSTAVCYWQSTKSTEDLKAYALNSVLFSLLRHVAYNTLRTQEQLGYVVF